MFVVAEEFCVEVLTGCMSDHGQAGCRAFRRTSVYHRRVVQSGVQVLVEEERRKADSPFGFLSLSRSDS
jgi:hypothetical protein